MKKLSEFDGLKSAFIRKEGMQEKLLSFLYFYTSNIVLVIYHRSHFLNQCVFLNFFDDSRIVVILFIKYFLYRVVHFE